MDTVKEGADLGIIELSPVDFLKNSRIETEENDSSSGESMCAELQGHAVLTSYEGAGEESGVAVLPGKSGQWGGYILIKPFSRVRIPTGYFTEKTEFVGCNILAEKQGLVYVGCGVELDGEGYHYITIMNMSNVIQKIECGDTIATIK